jgi:hypothetical protein
MLLFERQCLTRDMTQTIMPQPVFETSHISSLLYITYEVFVIAMLFKFCVTQFLYL